MKFLITGGSGQLAKAFIKECEINNIDYIAPDSLELDVTNLSKVSSIISQYNPTAVINCAAYNNVETAEKDNNAAYLINEKAVANIAKETRKNNIKFIHFGSDYVFDGNKSDFYIETDGVNPLNVYGKSKSAGEQEALKYGNSLVLRLSWVIGNGKQNFLYKFSNWAKNNKTIKVSCDEISVPCFTFDIAKYCLLALNNNLTGLYHLTNSSKASRYELAAKFAKLMGFSNDIIPVPMATFASQVKRPLQTAMSNGKISKELNVFIPTWQESLEKYTDIIKKNENF